MTSLQVEDVARDLARVEELVEETEAALAAEQWEAAERLAGEALRAAQEAQRRLRASS